MCKGYLKLFISAVLLLVPFSVSQANESCPGEGQVRSLNGDISTTLVFQNRAESEEDSFKIYWLDYQGNRKLYKQLFKGEAYTVSTFLTHPWVVTSPEPGGGELCVKIYMPDPGKRVVTLR